MVLIDREDVQPKECRIFIQFRMKVDESLESFEDEMEFTTPAVTHEERRL